MSDVLIWQCLTRISILREFGEAIETYANHSQIHRMASIPNNNEGERARERINQLVPRVARYLREAGVYPHMSYVPAPAVGGAILPNVDLLANIFQLRRFDASFYDISDAVQKAIGYYQDETFKALIRTLNPFWWLARLIAFLIGVPIRILAWAGYGRFEKLESSKGGRIYKAIAGLVAFALGVVALLANAAQIMSFVLQLWRR
jgi:hypothetical protein